MIKRLLTLLVIFVSLSLLSSRGYAERLAQGAEGSYQLFFPVAANLVPHDWIGPEGGLIAALAIDPQNPSNIFAGSWDGGIYKSSDGGETWKRASYGLGNWKVISLAIDPSVPDTLYAGTYKSKIYKSTDGGVSWQLASQGIQEEAIVYAIVIDPQNPQRIYAATRGRSNNDNRPWAGVVYRSEDGGASWFPSLYNLGGADYQDWAYALAINPNAPRMIFAATHEHGPLRSDDYGKTWKVLKNGISNVSTRAVVVDPRANYAGTVYTGVWTKDGVFKSVDSGENWALKSSGLIGAQIYRMAINPFSPNTLYAGTYNMGVMKTTNGATKWVESGLKWVGISSLQVSLADGGTVFAGTDADGLYQSQDGGQTWVHSQSGLTASSVTSLIVSPDDPSSYFASLDGGGVMHSLDHGLSWSAFNQNLDDRVIHALVEHPANNTLFALTNSSGLYRCDLGDGSACWLKVGLSLLTTGSPSSAQESVQPFEFSETYQRSYDPTSAAGGPLAPGASVSLLTMVFAPSDPNIVYLGTNGAGVYKSADGGSSWERTGWANQGVGSIAVHPQNPNLLYATAGLPEMIRTSQDGGNSWQTIQLPGLSVFALAISIDQPDRLLAGTNDGVYQLVGGVWTRIGLAGETVTAIRISPYLPNYYVVGTTNGAWISLDSGSNWIPGPIELQGIQVNSISFSPQAPERIFYNTLGHGTLRTGIDH